ncbi:hypothetical protein QIH80_37275 [Bradyrhizobium elkanii]|nr:hypothetical protein QIH80_37275 [Bradyrhizobium elkanii]
MDRADARPAGRTREKITMIVHTIIVPSWPTMCRIQRAHLATQRSLDCPINVPRVVMLQNDRHNFASVTQQAVQITRRSSHKLKDSLDAP